LRWIDSTTGGMLKASFQTAIVAGNGAFAVALQNTLSVQMSRITLVRSR
jgi:hypothetical protein